MKAMRIHSAQRILSPRCASSSFDLASSTTRQQRRTFLPFNPLAANTTTPTQTLTASRTLPYPSRQIYAIIADVSSYDKFLPFCSRSTVTRWSLPDAISAHRWPSEAELEVGWKGVSERFVSRVYCVPGRVVEAVGGRTETTLRREEIAHHLEGEALSGRGSDESVLSHLLTRWTVRDAAGGSGKAPRTDVDLAIEFQFANPIYSAMSGAVADKVAGYMIEAFEKRVKEVLAEKEVGR